MPACIFTFHSLENTTGLGGLVGRGQGCYLTPYNAQDSLWLRSRNPGLHTHYYPLLQRITSIANATNTHEVMKNN